MIIDYAATTRLPYRARMSTSGKKHRIGPEWGRLVLRTSRAGIAAGAGHDLTIVVDRWSGVAALAEQPLASSIEVTVQVATLRVLEGTGGVKPLSDRDKREIAQTARRLLDTDRHPEARFVSTKVQESSGGGVIQGALTLRGRERPLELTVTALGDGHYRAVASVRQSDYGIKPYTAFLGTLKLADEVQVEAEVELSEQGT